MVSPAKISKHILLLKEICNYRSTHRKRHKPPRRSSTSFISRRREKTFFAAGESSSSNPAVTGDHTTIRETSLWSFELRFRNLIIFLRKYECFKLPWMERPQPLTRGFRFLFYFICWDGSFGYDLRLSEEEHFNASDADGDGFLNLAEFNDFLHPADSNSPKIKEWLSKVDVRESDTDRDGKVSFKEFFYGLFDSVRYYDEESYNDLHQSDDSTDASARALFSQLDKDRDGSLSDIELLPIIGKLHPSGHYYAKKQAEYLISLAEVDKDGRLNLTEMIENAYIFYDAIFYDDEVEYDDSPDKFF